MSFRVIQWATVGQGPVVNISSRLASVTQTMFVAYGSTKAALPRMTRNIAPQLAPPRGRVKAIYVGGGATPSLESVLIDDDLRRGGSSMGPRWGVLVSRGHRMCRVVPGVRRVVLGHGQGVRDRWRHRGWFDAGSTARRRTQATRRCRSVSRRRIPR